METTKKKVKEDIRKYNQEITQDTNVTSKNLRRMQNLGQDYSSRQARYRNLRYD